MLTKEDAEEIAAIIESHLTHPPAPPKRSHWPRRFLLIVLVLVATIATHYLMENVEAKSGLQAVELLLASLFDSVFSRVREV